MQKCRMDAAIAASATARARAQGPWAARGHLRKFMSLRGEDGITWAGDGHVKTDERRPTCVVHECRRGGWGRAGGWLAAEEGGRRRADGGRLSRKRAGVERRGRAGGRGSLAGRPLPARCGLPALG